MPFVVLVERVREERALSAGGSGLGCGDRAARGGLDRCGRGSGDLRAAGGAPGGRFSAGKVGRETGLLRMAGSWEAGSGGI